MGQPAQSAHASSSGVLLSSLASISSQLCAAVFRAVAVLLQLMLADLRRVSVTPASAMTAGGPTKVGSTVYLMHSLVSHWLCLAHVFVRCVRAQISPLTPAVPDVKTADGAQAMTEHCNVRL